VDTLNQQGIDRKTHSTDPPAVAHRAGSQIGTFRSGSRATSVRGSASGPFPSTLSRTRSSRRRRASTDRRLRWGSLLVELVQCATEHEQSEYTKVGSSM
jgi:hypothetical protein